MATFTLSVSFDVWASHENETKRIQKTQQHLNSLLLTTKLYKDGTNLGIVLHVYISTMQTIVQK